MNYNNFAYNNFGMIPSYRSVNNNYNTSNNIFQYNNNNYGVNNNFNPYNNLKNIYTSPNFQRKDIDKKANQNNSDSFNYS